MLVLVQAAIEFIIALLHREPAKRLGAGPRMQRGTKRVLEYARLAMGFANVRASRYGIR